MIMMYFRILLLLSVLHWAHSRAEIKYISENQIKYIGETAELVCDTANSNSLWVYWIFKKNPEDIVLSKDHTMVDLSDPRISVKPTQPFTLRIKNVTESDAGVYECRIPYDESRVSDVVELKVLNHYPEITYISDNLIKDVGENVTFICNTHYTLDYPVLWQKVDKSNNEVKLVSAGNSLILRDSRFSLATNQTHHSFKINNVRESDAGVYECEISISTDNRITKQVELIVTTKPELSAVSERKIKNVGETAEFVCNTKSIMNYPVLWFKLDKNGTNKFVAGYVYNVLVASSDCKFSVRSDKLNSYTLQIKNIQETDAGKYSCQILYSTTVKKTVELELQVKSQNVTLH